ncbi:MAG: glutathione S-transferase family protein [Tropicimonas sp.]|uniref:glutathione S-transferase family protein n=1 Tax=Tropicimonas sp. TaxID=2067044 RepID=UPI003A887FF7
MTIRLHCFGESGNAYKAALTLELAGIGWEPVFVDFFHGETRGPAFRALNPMGEVPVLVDGDLVLTQSGVIQDYVAEISGRLGAPDAAGRREILRWILFDNHKNSGIAGPVRFNMNFLAPERRSEEVNAFLRARHGAAMRVLDACLAGRDWLVGDGPTIADIANCGYLFYPEPFGFERAAYPNIDAWLGRIAALPGWKHPYDLMPGSPANRAPEGGDA